MRAFFEISGLNIYLQIAVTIISIAVHLFVTRNKKRAETTLDLITQYTIGLAGWFSINSGVFGHLIFADEVARSIGWPLNCGFQMELAFAAIGIGIVGFLGFWNRSFWLPFIIAKTSLMWGAGVTHAIHINREKNLSPSNTGIVLYWDFLFPIIMIVLYIYFRREQNTIER